MLRIEHKAIEKKKRTTKGRTCKSGRTSMKSHVQFEQFEKLDDLGGEVLSSLSAATVAALKQLEPGP